MPMATLPGVELYYEMAGAGPRLLFVSGSGGDLRQKPSVFEGPLAADFEILAYDQRGLGRSGKPDRAYTMADYADDAARLLDHVGWARCLVLGVSFGGMVAQELALRHPDRVDRLVLACTSSGGEGGASYPLHRLSDLARRARALRGLELADRRHDAAWRRAHPEAAERILALVEARQLPAADGGAEADRAAEGARRQLEARRGHDTWSRLPRLRVPTLVCGGRYDGIAPPENQEALARRIPGAQLELFDGGHMFLVQDRSALPRIARFLVGAAAG